MNVTYDLVVIFVLDMSYISFLNNFLFGKYLELWKYVSVYVSGQNKDRWDFVCTCAISGQWGLGIEYK